MSENTYQPFENRVDFSDVQHKMQAVKNELKKWKELALKEGVKIITKFALTDLIAHWVIDYVKVHKIDLLIVDYPKLSMVEANHHDDIINQIHQNAGSNGPYNGSPERDGGTESIKN